uniref:hypothetical protein n=1 Tax=Amycolatopsis sp. CA-290885 TaxID=3239925 RepID=UPI003F49920E
MSLVSGRLDDVDMQIEKIHRLVDGAIRLDPELATGAATTESLASVQRKIDQAAAGVEDLESDLKAAIREGRDKN